MRKPLIAALGLVSLVSLAHAENYGIKDIGAKISPDHLKSICGSNGGAYTAYSGGGVCKFKWGETWNCNNKSDCVGWKGLVRPNTKVGESTTSGGLGSARFPGGSTGYVPSTGATAPVRVPPMTATGALNASPNGPVVRDHRPGGNAADAPPLSVGALNASANDPVVRDHRAGGNAQNAKPLAAAAGSAPVGQKRRALQ
jgi:hypothetical protein